jgi:hypothetical protein
MRCSLCNQRKGKRHCPAKNAMICAQCCGEKRILEIDCPETCQYLQIGRSHEASQEGARHLWRADPMKQGKYDRVLSEFPEVVSRLQFRLAEERWGSRDLTDRDVAEALSLLLETYRTEDKGVLYDHVSGDLRVDSLRRQLRDLMESLRHPEESAEKRLLLRDAMDCLEFMHDWVTSHMKDRLASMSFVDFLARHVPRPSQVKDSGSSIIIPGR